VLTEIRIESLGAITAATAEFDRGLTVLTGETGTGKTMVVTGLHLLGGEPRARHLYAEPGAASDVLAAWREVLGDRAWVLSRDEAIKEGWFGPVDDRMAPRIGDVVAAPAGSLALVAMKTEPRESALFGMHGSLTSSEQLVPALMFRAA